MDVSLGRVKSFDAAPPEQRSANDITRSNRRVDDEVMTMALKNSYGMKELAELLDIGETTLQNQIIPVIKMVMTETLDKTLKTIANQSERIDFLERENRRLCERLEALEEHAFAPSERIPVRQSAEAEPAMVDLESVLGIELDAEPAGTDEPVFTVESPQKPHGRRHQLLKRVQKWRKNGLTFRQIADRLNSNRTPTLSGRGRWDAPKARRLFTKR
ncbi:hypothetical protein D3OALGA1CA_1540 [Olavius algarvensis associated proteobacterium Delta 3]|nr:hypothetical protein D3OALGB2SA_340 [Olavius algarvensis associated proteobacterium Delta 3]CAB5102709.1 hypothetical protein D3OALGA1CA_1540 [Olavius algarvensis associated proteobacterium Delta 3]